MDLKRTVVIMILMSMLIVTVSSCTTRLLDFTVVSSKNTEMQIPTSSKGERVEGKDGVPIIFFPLGNPNLKEACDRAIESAGPEYDALIDGVIYSKFIYFIFGYMEYKVEGTPIISSQINTTSIEGNAGGIAQSKPILYHSKTGKSNDEAIQKIGIVQIEN